MEWARSSGLAFPLDSPKPVFLVFLYLLGKVDTSSLLYLHELQCYITYYHIPDMHLLPPICTSYVYFEHLPHLTDGSLWPTRTNRMHCHSPSHTTV